MNSEAQILHQLKDVHLPHPVAFWPPALGWWLVTCILLLLSIGLSFWYYKRHLSRRAKKEGLRALERIAKQPSNAQSISDISIILKRVALAYFPRQKVAGLSGQDWLLFLAKTSGNKEFLSTGKILITAAYQVNTDIEVAPVVQLAKKWIQKIGSD